MSPAKKAKKAKKRPRKATLPPMSAQAMPSAGAAPGEPHDGADTQGQHGLAGLLAETRERVLQRALLVRQRTSLTNAIKAIDRRLGRVGDQSGDGTHEVLVAGDFLAGDAPRPTVAGDHHHDDAHGAHVAGDHEVFGAQVEGVAGDQSFTDAQRSAVAGARSEGDHTRGEPQEIAVSLAAHSVNALWLARQALQPLIAEHEKRLAELAEELFALKPPVRRLVEETRGLGPLGLMLLVGHARDPGAYPNPAKLWKRFGVGLVDGVPQRRVARNAEAAKRMGFSPTRRAALHTIGDALVKLNDGRYRALYDTRKVREREKLPDASDMHVHKRAMRYMEKRLLLDLWKAWRERPSIG